MNATVTAMLQMPPDLKVWFLVSAALAMFASFFFLGAMFAREAVKRDLLERNFEPLHIAWRPFAYWAIFWSTPFRVTYRDEDKRLHKAYCCVYYVSGDSPFGTRRVRWMQDELRDFIDV